MGKALTRAGAGLMIGGVLLGFVLRVALADAASGEAIAIGLLPLLMLLAGAFCFWRGRQYAAKAVAQRPASGTGPYVLYLRDFRSDPSTSRQVFSALVTPALLSGLTTEEEQLAEVLQPFGELVAIGQPGEALPLPGAVRLYATEEQWREVVTNQMRDARLVVLRAGSGEGVLWELQQAARIVDPRKLLLLVILMKKEPFRYFRQTATAILGVPLPDAERQARFGRISGFITFSADWQPAFLPLHAPLLRRSAFKPLRRMFTFALKPVFEAFGVPWRQPPVSRLMVSAFALAGLIALLLAAGVALSLRDNAALDREPGTDAVEDPFDAAVARLRLRLQGSPRLRRALENTGGDLAAAQAVGSDLASKGLRRLDDERLIARARLMARILAESDPSTCAAIFRGDPAPGLEAVLRRMPKKEIDEWFELTFVATSAELQETPAPAPPPPAEAQRAFQELLGTLSPADAKFLYAMVVTPRAGTIDDACRAARLFYGGIAALPAPSKATLARVIVQQ